MRAIVERLAAAARPDAIWQICDFRMPERGWRRRRAQVIHALMYSVFRAATRLEARHVTPPDPWLEAAGFVLRHRRVASAGLLHADLWGRGSFANERVLVNALRTRGANDSGRATRRATLVANSLSPFAEA